MKVTINEPTEICFGSLENEPPARILAVRRGSSRCKASIVRIAIDHEGYWRRVGFNSESTVSFTGIAAISYNYAIKDAINSGYEVHIFYKAKDYARAILNFYEELDYEEEP